MSGKPATTRLFLALWPEQGIRDQLAQWRDAWRWPQGAASVPDDKLHVTLHFLGNQPSERVPEIMQGLAVPFAPFRLSLGQAKLWPHGIAVLEPHMEPDELLQLHADLAQALVALGLLPEERKYRPHVTMSRRAPNAIAPTDGPLIDWEIQRYALVESRPGNGGYAVLKYYT
ncbi:RNA 2',3'-cyclic phosphodiesterase [Massilia horti]|uniref:RNA 2',3'-cyclic phosphodiesterase n=1 Tax=Massilia horti TaxID=2562153 RepID=A0A4Y9T1C9_9BURK|nr:RNA 2',3'-cyclic phosphodiesterase [Massilia horti]TFW33270.1 RNA 2',3'-cyclic phosphodiesterase [Massilia horti]